MVNAYDCDNTIPLNRHCLDLAGFCSSVEEHDALFRRFSSLDSVTILTLDWKAPKTFINSLFFQIRGNTLLAFGDLYDAVYSWSSPISWNWLAGLGIGYFSEKCRASPHGAGGLRWNAEKAFKAVWDLLRERASKYKSYKENSSNTGLEVWLRKQVDELHGAKPEAVRDYFKEACYTQFSFYNLLDSNNKLFSDPTSLLSLGLDTCTEVRNHLLSLIYAVQRVKDHVWVPRWQQTASGFMKCTDVFCATHDNRMPTFELPNSSGWNNVSTPVWFK